MNCCARCFGDRGLTRNIIPLRSTGIGLCSYCGSADVPIVRPSELSEYFELLIGAYRPDSSGRTLVRWMRDDWGLFDHPLMSDSHAKDLLAEILNNGEVVRQTFRPIITPSTDRLGQWEKLRDELMYRNRFFPDANIDHERLELLLSHLTVGADETPSRWYRARIQISDKTYTAEEMGAPPKRVASHGRANPAGIPYLYLGSTVLSAISEIRPHTGEIACVIDFSTPADLRLADLRSPRRMVSPFLLADVVDISRMRSDLPFLERLGDELTRPVVPQAAAIDYTPSQYLCEFIKKCGYDGVLYRSSVSDGINLALFDPSRAQPGTVSQYRIAKATVEATIISPT